MPSGISWSASASAPRPTRSPRSGAVARPRRRGAGVRANTACGCLGVADPLDAITADFAGFWRRLASDSQLRWLGPEKGVIHLALAAIVNAVWDLYAKAERKPLWKLLADMTPRQLVSCIDFRYITAALTAGEAIDFLERHAGTQAGR